MRRASGFFSQIMKKFAKLEQFGSNTQHERHSHDSGTTLMMQAQASDHPFPAELHAPSRSRWKWALMLAVGLLAAGLLGATLRARPQIDPQTVPLGFADDASFQQTLE